MLFPAGLRFTARKIREKVTECWRPYTRAVSASAAEDFIQQVSNANPLLKFRSVPQGSHVKYLYRVDQNDSLPAFESGSVVPKTDDTQLQVDAGRNEWIPLCMKTVKSSPNKARYSFTFRSALTEGLGLVLMGTEPQHTFMLPSDSVVGRTHLYTTPYEENSQYCVEGADGTLMANVLIDWWENHLIDRVQPTTWVTQLLASKETGKLETPPRALLHCIAQLEEMVRASCQLNINYTPAISGSRKHRGIIRGKEVVFNLGTPVNTSVGRDPVYLITLSKTYRDQGDFTLIMPHQEGHFGRFFLFPRAFLGESAPNTGVATSSYYIYPSDRQCPHQRSQDLQVLQERFEIKCDQESLRILPGYEQKFLKILTGEIV